MTDASSVPEAPWWVRWGDASSRMLHWFRADSWKSYATIGVLAVLLAGLVGLLLRPVTPPSTRAPAAAVAGAAATVGPDTPLPAVEPVELMAVDADTAREINARVAFVTGPNPAARPYVTALAGDDLQRAVDCLAAAQLYEAGNDPEGEAAVAQVVLNRVRHPAFPNSVCGVIFQGSERTTGCQFTFACDGALVRTPRPEAWKRAQAIALQMLTGRVFAQVGLATHYHTDWVVPYWSATLDKLTAVKTHLFFRWRGGWGAPRAFASVPTATEPRVAKLASLSDVHKDVSALDALRLDRMIADMAIGHEGGAVYMALPPTMSADAFPALAERLCQGREACSVYGWADRGAVPAAVPGATADAHFVFTRGGGGAGTAQWDCRRFARASAKDCLAIAASTPVAVADQVAPAAVPVLADAAVPDAMPAAVATPEPARRRRIDPCRALRGVDDRVGFCAGR